MDDAAQKLSRTIWVGVGLVIVILCVSFVLSQYDPKKRIPAPPVLSQVADFSLTNQLGEPVSLANLRGHVWVADIIFTSCAGPCPQMTKHMRALQDALPAKSTAQLITLTTDPGTDKPEVMMKYAERFGANPQRWQFLTGEKIQIVGLAVDSLKMIAVEKKPEERTDPADLFIHTTSFMVVDKKGQLRAKIETTGEGIDFTKIMPDLLALIRQLEQEK